MAASQEISHSGKIVEIDPQFITVEIVSESACSACHASGLCGLAESKTKAVQVPFTFGEWEVGQEVWVNLRKSMGHKAVWVAYVVPLFVMIAVLLALLGLGVGELLSGLVAIGAVGLYYLVVYLFRERLRNEYMFYIKAK